MSVRCCGTCRFPGFSLFSPRHPSLCTDLRMQESRTVCLSVRATTTSKDRTKPTKKNQTPVKFSRLCVTRGACGLRAFRFSSKLDHRFSKEPFDTASFQTHKQSTPSSQKHHHLHQRKKKTEKIRKQLHHQPEKGGTNFCVCLFLFGFFFQIRLSL